jgi:hypothetical protein
MAIGWPRPSPATSAPVEVYKCFPRPKAIVNEVKSGISANETAHRIIPAMIGP